MRAMKEGALQPGKNIRGHFPIYSKYTAEAPLAYLDTAASSQKPAAVIDRLRDYLSFEHANIHRGAYKLSAKATEGYEHTRDLVAGFIGAGSSREIIFTRGTTEAINLVAYAFENYFKAGDVILLSLLEHHSNIVPWQLLAERKQLSIEWIEIDSNGALSVEDAKQKLKTLKPKLLAITQVANSLGSVVPIKELTAVAHEVGTVVLVDAAQSVVHTPINVVDLDCDFLALSGHKLYGPTGVGVLYGKARWLELMQPFQGGGDMIQSVTTRGSTYAAIPQKFEAGTPAIAEVIALAEAIGFVEQVGRTRLQEHESALFNKTWEIMKSEPGVKLYGPANVGGAQASIISFNLEGVHPHDLSSVADQFNVQFRGGHHCAMPTLHKLGLQSSARISFGVYSDLEDILRLKEALRYARKLFQ